MVCRRCQDYYIIIEDILIAFITSYDFKYILSTNFYSDFLTFLPQQNSLRKNRKY